MEKVIEIALMFLWDAIKTLILQWLMTKLKEWWESRKDSAGLQYA
jgi:hypothetical protein